MKSLKILSCIWPAIIGSLCPGESRESLRYDWPLYVYNFGGLEKHPVEEQVNLLHRHGYAGMAVDIGSTQKLAEFERYRGAAGKIADFKIYTAFYRFNYDEKSGFSRDWTQAVDRLAGTGTDLWLITGQPQNGLTPELLEKEIRDLVDYAATKSLKVTLYPHSKNVIATAEEALVYVEKVNRPNFDLAVHTCHENRAGNAGRIEEVLEKVKKHLGHVTIAGSDNIPNQTSGSEWEYSTLKPLYRGNFDLTRVLKKLRSLDYRGPIGFINHRIAEPPDTYLPLSKAAYEKWIQDLNVLPAQPFDAPDQCVWHEPSRTWFVSNLGGGISLEKDAYANELGVLAFPQHTGDQVLLIKLDQVSVPDNKLIKTIGEDSTKKVNLANSADPSLNDTHAPNFIEAIRGNAKLTAPIDQGHCSTLLAQLGNIVQRSGRSLKIDPANGHILDDPEAAKLWTRDYEPGWEPTV